MLNHSLALLTRDMGGDFRSQLDDCHPVRFIDVIVVKNNVSECSHACDCEINLLEILNCKERDHFRYTQMSDFSETWMLLSTRYFLRC